MLQKKKKRRQYMLQKKKKRKQRLMGVMTQCRPGFSQAAGRNPICSMSLCSSLVALLLFCLLGTLSAVFYVQGFDTATPEALPVLRPQNLTLTSVGGLRRALMNSLLFYEGQRSGRLPSSQRVKWRGDSGLTDGHAAGLDLTGGYYDAGDNVKFVWTIAHTVTMLSWSAIQYKTQLSAAGELAHAVDAIKWGSDFLLKAAVGPTRLITQVGDGNSDHACWERPEDMDTPRTLVEISEKSPGTEVAADTAAALAAASIVLHPGNPRYATRALKTAKQMFDFADRHRGSYSGSCPFYCSFSGYNDELLWGAAWLYTATKDVTYLNYVKDNINMISTVQEFSWDSKSAGVQILLSKIYFQGQESLAQYNNQAKSFLCAVLPANPSTSIHRTPGGLLFVRGFANLQYVTGAAFLVRVYADYITQFAQKTLSCSGKMYDANDLITFSRSQAEYILGNNPKRESYMVGYSRKYPQQLHHRGSSIPSIRQHPKKVACSEGYNQYFSSQNPNPNVHVGAIPGGPDENDGFNDDRSNPYQLEPVIYINAPFVGLLASFL